MPIDLRSDTVTRPTPEMRQAMANAEVGDDVHGEDPTVNRLQELAAEMLGKEAALFCPSGTQTNFCALLSHCERGDEYIVGQRAHTYMFEGGGAAVFGSIQPQPIDFEQDGTIDLQKAATVIKLDNVHFPITRLLCLENTQDGKVLSLEYLEQARDFADVHGLNLHLDGARVFNAAVKLGIPISEIAQHFDSVSVCLSKGLGAPVGSVLVGSEDLVTRALRWRKVAGGGMRQAGIIAAGCIHALENHVARLAEDHEKAQRLVNGFADIDEVKLLPQTGQTNMVFLISDKAKELTAWLKERDILISGYGSLRLVTHLDATLDDMDTVVNEVKAFFAKGS
ncbi:MAG: low-specificity L-threonine aldolase [Planctomycetota bacterium]|jgi:threonine aldolase|nr:low-specificity L-threonine aldolase [Planctomycetota bacterium]